MTGFVVVLAPEAERDVADAFTYYRARNELAADSFRTEVLTAIDRIGAAPLARPADPSGLRYRTLRHFPYSVFYELVDSRVSILAIAHHRRRPGYWRNG